MHYQNFDLEIIDPQGSRQFCARVLDSPQGDCPFIDVKWPFEVEEEGALLAEIYGGLRQRRARPSKVSTTQDFGSRLFEAVFTSDIEHLFRSSVETAARAGKGLRIRLRLPEDSELHAVPWEYLYDTDSRAFLAVSEHTPLIRYLPVAQPISPIAVEGPLRILVALSAPTDHPRLDIEREWEILCYALEPSITAGLIELRRVPGRCTFDNLRDSLRHFHAHIFHFVGHGKPGALVLEQESGKSLEMEATHLRSAFRMGALPRLIVLNACSGALAEDAPFSGLAQGFLKQGVPAVVAMQASITDDAALILSRYFYRELIASGAVDASLTEARLRMQVNGHPFEWGTPVLYMRALSGQLFQPKAILNEQEQPLPAPRRASTPTPRQAPAPQDWNKPWDAPPQEAEPFLPPRESTPTPRPEHNPAERKKPKEPQAREPQPRVAQPKETQARERTEPPRPETGSGERKKPREPRVREPVPQQGAAHAQHVASPSPVPSSAPQPQLPPEPQPQLKPQPQPQPAVNLSEQKQPERHQPAESALPPEREPDLDLDEKKQPWHVHAMEEALPFKREPRLDQPDSPSETRVAPHEPSEQANEGRLRQLRQRWPVAGLLFLVPVMALVAYNIFSPRKSTPVPEPVSPPVVVPDPATRAAPAAAPQERVLPATAELSKADATPGATVPQSHASSPKVSAVKPAPGKAQRTPRQVPKPAVPAVKKGCNNPEISDRSVDCLFQ